MKITIDTKTTKITHIESCCPGMANMICTEQIHITFPTFETTKPQICIPGTTTYSYPVIPSQLQQPNEDHTMEFCPKCGNKIEITIKN